MHLLFVLSVYNIRIHRRKLLVGNHRGIPMVRTCRVILKYLRRIPLKKDRIQGTIGANHFIVFTLSNILPSYNCFCLLITMESESQYVTCPSLHTLNQEQVKTGTHSAYNSLILVFILQ